ncbi:predicted protein [Naegleria gruberi]|uniref:Predicted protein n=1 Tax=Naegleria gruberi TaxID=5762 RepID=D2VTA8_NAEGR|nr:uncharacterized protein NAEGRDRAFT_72234 [Naegleria gruberi]EFC39901.1 predicted protein [Naegleria gruberi]|eukprot:XP_002672645.1 predicted protein [Naegleria gruberi strain NEG-M]
MCQTTTVLFHTFNQYFYIPYNILMKNYFTLIQQIPYIKVTKKNESVVESEVVENQNEGQNFQRVFVFEYQSLNYFIIFTLFTCMAYFNTFTNIGIFSYLVQFALGFCMLILQFWLSKVVQKRKYFAISCILIFTGLFLLRVFVSNTLTQYFLAFVFILFITPVSKFLYKSLPLLIPDQTLLQFAFVWLVSLQMLGVIAFFLRGCVYVYFYI